MTPDRADRPLDPRDDARSVGHSPSGAIYTETDHAVMSIVLNRPEKRNALSLAMWQSLTELAHRASAADDVRALVVRSSTPVAFSAGADISEFKDTRSNPVDGALYNQAVADAETALATCPKPTVAIVRGFAIGGGSVVAMACDFRVGDESAEFGIPASKLGIVYPPVSIERLADVVGTQTARRMLLAGQRPKGAEAYRLGLLDFLSPSDEVVERGIALARELSEASAFAYASIKEIFEHMLLHRIGPEAHRRYREVEHGTYELDEYQGNVARFTPPVAQ
jgi:enoyl-CoA hydratase